MAQPRYKTEVFVPIKQDNKTFEERQKNIFDTMHERMERRRREWETEVDGMRKDFFSLKPQEKRRGSSENLLDTMDLNDIFYDDVKAGDKRFRVSFDVRQFQPNEISVRTEDQKLMVHAKHEDTGDARSVSREFSRQVDIPKHVDPQKLQCTLSNDGILQLEAPVSAPAYNRIRENVSSGVSSPVQSKPTLRIGPVLTEQDGSRKFKISVDVGADFSPQDVVVKTVDKKVIVHARHEEKVPGRSSCKEFSREIDLPEDVDPNLVTASMTEDGHLMIEAPVSNFKQGSYSGKPGSSKRPQMTITIGKRLV